MQLKCKDCGRLCPKEDMDVDDSELPVVAICLRCVDSAINDPL